LSSGNESAKLASRLPQALKPDLPHCFGAGRTMRQLPRSFEGFVSLRIQIQTVSLFCFHIASETRATDFRPTCRWEISSGQSPQEQLSSCSTCRTRTRDSRILSCRGLYAANPCVPDTSGNEDVRSATNEAIHFCAWTLPESATPTLKIYQERCWRLYGIRLEPQFPRLRYGDNAPSRFPPSRV